MNPTRPGQPPTSGAHRAVSTAGGNGRLDGALATVLADAPALRDIIQVPPKLTPTSIAWAGYSWNFVHGCTKVSEGCRYCYADALATWLAGTKAWPNGFEVTLRPERLDWPFHWPAGERVFVVSMGDPFHDQVPDWLNQRAFAVMALCGHLQFLLLTKRPGVMRSKLNSPAFWAGVDAALAERGYDPSTIVTLASDDDGGDGGDGGRWLTNLWLGTSVEDQAAAALRIPHLRATPAAIRWLSCEPLLGRLDLGGYLAAGDGRPGLDLVVVGGESGPHARPMQLGWVEALVRQCRQARVAPYVKQLGAVWARRERAEDRKGETPAEWPAELRVRELPAPPASGPPLAPYHPNVAPTVARTAP